MKHDMITLGGSAGGLEVLLAIVGELPADLPVALFVAQHTVPNWTSPLPDLLSERGHLPASHPLHGEPIANGHIYVAPPDNHLLVRRGFVEVVRGPKENGHRPSVDALFRTASAAYGPRVIGVVLSGYQDCGTAGMMSIKARGGIAIAQAPATAQVPDMPRNAIERVNIDYVVPPAELASLLVRLVALPAAEESRPSAFVRQLEDDEPGVPAELVCPSCHGVLTEASQGTFQQFRCHVGHTFSFNSLTGAQNEEMERALWSAVRALEEGAALSRRMAGNVAHDLKQRFLEKAGTQAGQAEIIRKMLLFGAG